MSQFILPSPSTPSAAPRLVGLSQAATATTQPVPHVSIISPVARIDSVPERHFVVQLHTPMWVIKRHIMGQLAG